MTPLIVLCLTLAYPVLAHLAVVLNSNGLTMLSVGVLAAIALLPFLARSGVLMRFVAIVAVATLLLVGGKHFGYLVLYAPPVVLTAVAAWTFGRTLAPGRTPLIEHLVQLLHPPEERLDPAIAPYARRLTLCWAVLLGTLAVVSLVLALCAEPQGILLSLGLEPWYPVRREIWSLFANLLNYALIVAFFVLEYVWRRHRFPQQPYRNFLDFLRRAAAVGPRLIREARERA